MVLQGASLVGAPQTAKTTVLNQLLTRSNTEEASANTITFLYLTTPQMVQISVEVRRAAAHDLPASFPQQLSLIVGAGDGAPEVCCCCCPAGPLLMHSICSVEKTLLMNDLPGSCL